MGIIVLYDHKNERIGCVYPRRAKQLVLKGQAQWLKNGTSIKMTTAADSSLFSKEETIMTDDKMSNGVPKTAAHEPAEVESIASEPPFKPDTTEPILSKTDNLIYQQAKKNLQTKANLLKLVALTLVLWISAQIMHDAIFSNMEHPNARNIESIRSSLQSIEHTIIVYANFEWIPPGDIEGFNLDIQSARSNLSTIVRNYTPPIFYVLIGILLAWTAFVVAQIAKYVQSRWGIFRAVKRQNVLMKEYKRLKRIAVEE
ncbi:MAG: hypothetical protein FWG64_08170 [Firmicutes bacterium]|nr:hypothetical protein [Bacillota bacterium]